MFKLRCLVPVLAVIAIGCTQSDGPQRAVVTGRVTLAGEVVSDGHITFTPKPGVPGAPVKLVIKDGGYDSATDPIDDRGVPVGANLVEITAIKVTGKQIKNAMGEMEDEYLQYIPAKYNSETELEVDLTPGESNHDFKLDP
ncbi:hypothetical protein [Calycomorphotria hydatis]|uniref:Carboxypeptidase regulatory-like domain-containing protein n=1 Tax=Calycomorphotria hydatis TaxID=2528027 RepID=A0A517T643_9PLAN|nr:hypothetical protein [Calycomorphotria hydatis]QDT63834.1 hypothetical protein V22_10590 [Calycomorphotria hydatis]